MKLLLIAVLLITFYAYPESKGLECSVDYDTKIWLQIDLDSKKVIWNHTSQSNLSADPKLVQGRSLEETASRIFWKRGDRTFVLLRDTLELSWFNKRAKSKKYKCSLLTVENLIERRDTWYKFKKGERTNGK